MVSGVNIQNISIRKFRPGIESPQDYAEYGWASSTETREINDVLEPKAPMGKGAL